MKHIIPLNISKKVLALSLIGASILSPVNVLALEQPASAPITIPVPVPVTPAPDMIYPQNNQTLDLEGAYMFKVKPVAGATGYLFGLFQDGQMVYENLRDAKQLSPNGEFALFQSNPAHARFKAGSVQVMIRAMVNSKWTDARTITIILRPRISLPNPTPNPTPIGIGTTNPVGIGTTNPIGIGNTNPTQRVAAVPVVSKISKQALPERNVVYQVSFWRKLFNEQVLSFRNKLVFFRFFYR